MFLVLQYLFSSYIEDLLWSRSAQDPMFLYLPFQSVHAPLQVPEKYTHPYRHIKSHERRIKLGSPEQMFNEIHCQYDLSDSN